jgi:hypothetical protein
MICGGTVDGGPGALVEIQKAHTSALTHTDVSTFTEQQTKIRVTKNHDRTGARFRTTDSTNLQRRSFTTERRQDTSEIIQSGCPSHSTKAQTLKSTHELLLLHVLRHRELQQERITP